MKFLQKKRNLKRIKKALINARMNVLELDSKIITSLLNDNSQSIEFLQNMRDSWRMQIELLEGYMKNV